MLGFLLIWYEKCPNVDHSPFLERLMSSPAPRLANQRVPLRFVFLVLLTCLLGCSGGGETQVVDFSDTVQVARPA